MTTNKKQSGRGADEARRRRLQLALVEDGMNSREAEIVSRGLTAETISYGGRSFVIGYRNRVEREIILARAKRIFAMVYRESRGESRSTSKPATAKPPKMVPPFIKPAPPKPMKPTPTTRPAKPQPVLDP